LTDSNYIGCYGELLFFAECTKRGFTVSKPLLDSSPYDCIVDNKVDLFTVQIKSSGKHPREDDPNIQVPIQNSKQLYTTELVDYFAIYSTYYNGFFMIKNNGDMQGVRVSLSGKWKDNFNNYKFIRDVNIL
jgi:hypothetical protein